MLACLNSLIYQTSYCEHDHMSSTSCQGPKKIKKISGYTKCEWHTSIGTISIGKYVPSIGLYLWFTTILTNVQERNKER